MGVCFPPFPFFILSFFVVVVGGMWFEGFGCCCLGGFCLFVLKGFGPYFSVSFSLLSIILL